MNEIVNTFLLAGDKFMIELHLRQPGFTYRVCGQFTKNKERIQKFKETGDSQYIYQNELDKACFQHDMAYGDFKDLTTWTTSDKIFHDKAFDIAKNPKYDGYQHGLDPMVYKSFDKKSVSLSEKSASGGAVKNQNMPNKELAEELHKPIISKFKKRKVYSCFIDNIWGADLVDMHLIRKFNKAILFLLCVVDIFSKYAWVIPLKDKKWSFILILFQQLLMLFKKSKMNLIANQTKH